MNLFYSAKDTNKFIKSIKHLVRYTDKEKYGPTSLHWLPWSEFVYWQLSRAYIHTHTQKEYFCFENLWNFICYLNVIIFNLQSDYQQCIYQKQ